eukprot:SAG11_NODE_6540_length_1292_cov_2.098072_1_plen_75_part_10
MGSVLELCRCSLTKMAVGRRGRGQSDLIHTVLYHMPFLCRARWALRGLGSGEIMLGATDRCALRACLIPHVALAS